MKSSNITAHVLNIMVIVLMSFTQTMAQAKPKQSKEAILEWLCQKIEENHSSEIFTSGNELFMDKKYRIVQSCRLVGNTIQIKLFCTENYSDIADWKGNLNESWKTNLELYEKGYEIRTKQYIVYWNRNVEIPITKLQLVTIVHPEEDHLSHQYELNFTCTSNSIEVSNEIDRFRRVDDVSNEWWDENEVKRTYEGTNSNKSYTIKLKKDPVLKERIEKALVDLNSYFDTKEPY